MSADGNKSSQRKITEREFIILIINISFSPPFDTTVMFHASGNLAYIYNPK